MVIIYLTNFARVNYAICFMNDGESPMLAFEQRGYCRDILHKELYQPLLKVDNNECDV
jgi:hypothetical protein